MQAKRIADDPQVVEENRGYETPCWIWQHAIKGTGYGHLSLNGRFVLAHRFMYEREIGPIPDGLQIDHLCCVKVCVNPSHLEPVTQAENLRRRKGILLSVEKVREIRARAERLPGTMNARAAALVPEYELSLPTMVNLLYRHSWKDV